MKTLLRILVILAVAVAPSCLEIEEEISLNPDGSGKYSMTMDMNKMMEMMKGFGQEEADENPAAFGGTLRQTRRATVSGRVGGRGRDVDVLKVGHHGSNTSTGVEFAQLVGAELAVVSVARRNVYRLPRKQAMQRLQQTTKSVLFTSLENAIILESDGKTIRQVEWK